MRGSSHLKHGPGTRGIDAAPCEPMAHSDGPRRAISETRIKIPVSPHATGTSSAETMRAPAELPTEGMKSQREQPPVLAGTSDVVGASIFSAIAGYVDTAGFLALFGIFTAHITGDIVVGAALVEEPGQDGIALRLAMLPIFMSSVTVATLLARGARRRGRAPLALLLLLMSAALALFCLTGVALRSFIHGPSSWALALTASTGVGAMAIQNTLMRESFRRWTPTTIMTGNLTQATIHLVELVFPVLSDNREERGRTRKEACAQLVKFGLPVLGFATGVALSAYLTRLFALWSLILPATGVAVLGCWQWRHPGPSTGAEGASNRRDRQQGSAPSSAR